MEKCAFLLCSCDSYSDTWDVFFDLLNIYWPNIPYKVYLNTETLNYKPIQNYNFTITTINTSKCISWSKRLMCVLDKMEEDYVLMMLDDFFCQSPVRTEMVDKLVKMMEEDSSIASCQLTAARIAQEENIEIKDELSMNLMPKEGWKTHFIPTIWRKSVLRKWLRAHETIWGFEGYGSQRARIWNYKEKVYTIDSPIIYDYLWIDGCSVIVNGKWLDSEKVDNYFKSNNIDVNLNDRGRINYQEFKKNRNSTLLAKYSFAEIVVKCFNRILSYF